VTGTQRKGQFSKTLAGSLEPRLAPSQLQVPTLFFVKRNNSANLYTFYENGYRRSLTARAGAPADGDRRRASIGKKPAHYAPLPVPIRGARRARAFEAREGRSEKSISSMRSGTDRVVDAREEKMRSEDAKHARTGRAPSILAIGTRVWRSGGNRNRSARERRTGAHTANGGLPSSEDPSTAGFAADWRVNSRSRAPPIRRGLQG
jgi:hypothetical protein